MVGPSLDLAAVGRCQLHGSFASLRMTNCMVGPSLDLAAVGGCQLHRSFASLRMTSFMMVALSGIVAPYRRVRHFSG